jgi:hypothetical protein
VCDWDICLADCLCFGANGKLHVSTNSGRYSVVEYDPVTRKSSTLIMVLER